MTWRRSRVRTHIVTPSPPPRPGPSRRGACHVARSVADAARVSRGACLPSGEGPDTVENALCLCAFPHKLLDRGVLGVGDDHTVAVSAYFVGRGRAAEELVLRLAGRPLLEPQPGQPPLDEVHVAWPASQVFRPPARLPA